MQSLLLRPLLAFGAASALLAAGAAPAVCRDWTLQPALVESDSPEDIYVVGDPHAGYGRLLRALRGAGVTANTPKDPGKIEWAAGKSVLVIMGDLVDKGLESLEVIRLAKALATAAKESGGQVIVLAGNHETGFLAAPDSDKVRDFASELRKAGFDPKEVAACNGEIGDFLCGLPFAARVRDWFFAHAGNAGGRSLYQLANDIREAVDRNGYGAAELSSDSSIVEARLGSASQDIANWCEQGGPAKTVLENYALALGVARIVQGHEPGSVAFLDGVERRSGEIFQRDGRLFLMDAGMSEAVDKSGGGVLWIRAAEGGSATVVCPDGLQTLIWNAEWRYDTGRAARCSR